MNLLRIPFVDTDLNAYTIVSLLKMSYIIIIYLRPNDAGLGGVGVTCSPRDPRFVGSNPAEANRFFQDVKILSTSPPGETLSWGSRV